MCPTCIVLTDSPYVPATDTLTEITCKSTKKRKKVVLQFAKKVFSAVKKMPPQRSQNPCGSLPYEYQLFWG